MLQALFLSVCLNCVARIVRGMRFAFSFFFLQNLYCVDLLRFVMFYEYSDYSPILFEGLGKFELFVFAIVFLLVTPCFYFFSKLAEVYE